MPWLAPLSLLLAAFAAAAAPPVSVDKPSYALPPAPDDCAVVVGVERYERAPLADYAERDARAVAAHLQALGYPPEKVLLVVGGDARRSGLAAAVESWLPRCAKRESTVFFYFAGDGAPDAMSGAAYLLPADADLSRLEATTYPLSRLYARLERLPVKRVLVALDAGFSGEGARSARAPDSEHVITGAAAAGVPARVSALTAGALDQSAGAAPDESHGLFTYYLLRALNRSGGKADLKELRDAVAPQVSGDAVIQRREQTPQLFAQDGADLSLR